MSILSRWNRKCKVLGGEQAWGCQRTGRTNRRWCIPELGKEDTLGTTEDPGLEFSPVHQEALKGCRRDIHRVLSPQPRRRNRVSGQARGSGGLVLVAVMGVATDSTDRTCYELMG